MLLDVGANVDCTAQNLEQFAVMGDVYFRAMLADGPAHQDHASACSRSARKKPRVTN